MTTRQQMDHPASDALQNASYMNEPRSTWIVVADKNHARILAKSQRRLHPLHTISRSDMSVGLTNDTVGRGGAYGAGRHAYEPSMQESRQEEITLARDISHWLDHSLAQNRFESLVLIASPQMLGEIRKSLSKQVIERIIVESNKQMANISTPQLEEELRALLPSRLAH